MNSVLQIIYNQIQKRPKSPALFSYVSNTYHPMSYLDMGLTAQQLSQWMAMHCDSGNRIVIWSTNNWQWAITDLAAQLCGAISIPLYPTTGNDQLDYILSDASPSIVFVDTLTNARLSTLSKISGLKKIIVFDDKRPDNAPDLVLRFSDTLSETTKPDALNESQWVTNRLDDTLTILYTSGTTGTPKAVPLTHNNIVQNFLGLQDIIPISHTDSSLSFLPLSHIFERTVGFYCVLGVGAAIYYATSMDTVAHDLLNAKPTFIISVPRLYEKIHAKVMQTTGVKKRILKLALCIGKQFKKGHWLWAIAHRLVFSSIHQKTGGNVRFLVSGGAALSPHIEEFFNAIGLPVVQGYGLTETSPIISANLDQTIGSVGKVLPNVQLNVLPDTEIAVKGPSVFSGYLNVSNTDTFTDDGFFKTGDCGYVDDHGYLFITGRKKELIVLSNGKNVPPTHIEDILSQSDLIHQVMVIGNERPYLTALIVPEIKLLEHKLSMGHSDPSFDASAKKLILSDIAHHSSALASFETVKKIALIYDAFSIDGTELTPTLKLRRKIINKKYHDLINSLYDD